MSSDLSNTVNPNTCRNNSVNKIRENFVQDVSKGAFKTLKANIHLFAAFFPATMQQNTPSFTWESTI
jgi:hypothetical protein